MTEGDLSRVAIFGLGEAGSLIAADLVSAEVDVIGFEVQIPKRGLTRRFTWPSRCPTNRKLRCQEID